MSRLWLAALLLLACAGAARAQVSSAPLRLRLTLDEMPGVGRPAPAITLPYATSRGVGPAAQPFDLTKELGRVVVLVFYPGDFTPACTAEWRALRERAATLLAEGVEVVGVSSDSLAAHERFAAELDLPFKLLSDPDGTIIQRYGMTNGPRSRRAVVVIGRNGLVRYIDAAFAALDSESYVQLAAAVRAAKESR